MIEQRDGNMAITPKAGSDLIVNLEGRGEFVLNGGSMRMVDTVYDDLRVPLTSLRQGALSKPDYDFTNNGFLFPQNDAAEILYGITQMPHAWKEGTTIYPHLHWQQGADQAAVFKIEYKFFNPGAAVPAAFTTLSLDQYVFTYTSGNLHQISKSSAGISAAGKSLSAIFIFKLYRQDNVYTGDALAWQFDIHYERAYQGSAEQFSHNPQ